MRAVRIKLPRGTSPGNIETLLLGLHGLLAATPWWREPERAALEVFADADGIAFSVVVASPGRARQLTRVVRTALPGSEVADGDVETPDLSGMALARVRLGDSKASLRTGLPAASLGFLFGPLLDARRRSALVQLVVSPASPGARMRLLHAATRVERAGRGRGWAESFAASQLNRHRAGLLRDKAGSPLFRTGVLLAASSEALLHELASSFRLLDAATARVRRTPVLFPGWTARQLTRRLQPLCPPPPAVNVAELTALLAPAPERLIPGLTLPSRRLSPPPDAPARGRVLVRANSGGGRQVALSQDDGRFHTFVVGPTGTGKTTLLERQVLQAAEAGLGVVLLSPLKADALEHVLRRLPERRVADVVVIDPVTDASHPVGLNLLETKGGDASQVAGAVVGVLRDLHERALSPVMEDTAYNACYTLASTPGATLAELPRLLESAAFRAPFVARVGDTFVREYWAYFDALSAGQRAQLVGPLLNKVRPLLRPDLAPIVGQMRSSVDLDEVLAKRRILLIRLPREAEFFGALLVARLWEAVLRRANRSESRRPDVLLAIDEVHAFLRTGGDVAEMAAVARQLHLHLLVATQHLAQCPPQLREALLANCLTRVVFAPHETDAAALARGFHPELDSTDLMGLARFEVALRLSVGGSSSRPFTGRTLPLPEPVRPSSEPLRQRSRAAYGRPRAEVLAELRERLQRRDEPDVARIGRVSDRVTDR